jgi:hypothetical protein
MMNRLTFLILSLFFAIETQCSSLEKTGNDSWDRLFEHASSNNIMTYFTPLERARFAPVRKSINARIQEINTLETNMSERVIDQALKSNTKEELQKAFWEIYHFSFLSLRALDLAAHWSETLGAWACDSKIEASAGILKLNKTIDPKLKIEIPEFPITLEDIRRALDRFGSMEKTPEQEKELLIIRDRFLNSKFVRDESGTVQGLRHTFNHPTWIDGVIIFSNYHKTFELTYTKDIGFKKGIRMNTKGFIKISRKKRKFQSDGLTHSDPFIYIAQNNVWDCFTQDFQCRVSLVSQAIMSHEQMPQGFLENCDLVIHGNLFF